MAGTLERCLVTVDFEIAAVRSSFSVYLVLTIQMTKLLILL